MNLATGAVEYQHQYPLGYLAGQGTPGVAPDWVLVSASPDGHYVAESGVFNGTTAIRELPSGRIVASLHGSVHGFSWDGSRLVVSRWNGGSDYEAELLRWADQKVIWHRAGMAQSMLARPDSADVLIGIGGAEGGAPELVVVNGSGAATTIARDALARWPWHCPACQWVGGRLKFLDRTAEGLAAVCVPDSRLESRLGHPDHRSADAGTEEVERPHRQAKSMIDLTQDLIRRDEYAIQFEAADGMRRQQLKRGSVQSFRIAVHNEGGDPLGSGPLRGPGKE